MAVTHLRLPHLRADQRIVDENGRPTASFVRWFNDIISNTQGSFNNLADQEAEIEAAFNQAGLALTTATVEKAKNAIALSYTDPGAILTADISTADPTKAIITVAAHARHYGDGSVVNVLGGTVDLLQQGKTYYIVYDQSPRAGGPVTYQALGPVESAPTTYIDAAQTGAGTYPNRHACGSILTPATAGTPTHGGAPRPSGTGTYLGAEIP